MMDDKTQALSDAKKFARLHGLERLSSEHLARLVELAPKIAKLGGSIPRPPDKSDAPAERNKLSRSAS